MAASIIVTRLELQQPYEILGMIFHDCNSFTGQQSWKDVQDSLKYCAPKGTTHIMKTQITFGFDHHQDIKWVIGEAVRVITDDCKKEEECGGGTKKEEST